MRSVKMLHRQVENGKTLNSVFASSALRGDAARKVTTPAVRNEFALLVTRAWVLGEGFSWRPRRQVRVRCVRAAAAFGFLLFFRLHTRCVRERADKRTAMRVRAQRWLLCRSDIQVFHHLQSLLALRSQLKGLRTNSDI